jgi:hypothetical protein
MGRKPSGALSKLLLQPAKISMLIEDLPDSILVAKETKATRRKRMKSRAYGKEYYGTQLSQDNDGDQDEVHPSIIVASLK